ncbi:MAG TPA: DNA-directed RNA polymerase subunit K [Candidatus Omnitrophota bacterium]|nr:DNA-directed RNA polymerase subunit K [Candidatus Omnitrophota bacterium]
MNKSQFSRYEISRILGARALQIAMNAPLLVKISSDELEKIHFDPLKIAEMEFDSGILPISVNRPLPTKKEEKLKRIRTKSEDRMSEGEESTEEEIAKEGEIMELANPDDEADEAEEESGAGEGGEE